LNKTDSIEGRAHTLLATIEAVGERAAEQGRTERAKTRLLKQVDLSRTGTPEKVGLFMSESGLWAIGDYCSSTGPHQGGDPADVKRVAEAYLKSSNRTIGELIPDANRIVPRFRPRTDVAAAVNDYKGEAVMAPGKSVRSVAQEY